MTDLSGARCEVLDHGYIELVETWGSDEAIIETARQSTQKGFLGWGPRCDCEEGPRDSAAPGHCSRCLQPTKSGDEKLLAFLWKMKHSTPFEFAGATFEVQAPIFVFREWHRHRVPFGYSEASARYAPLPAIDFVPTVERITLRPAGGNKQAGTVAGAGELTAEGAAEDLVLLEEHYARTEALYQRFLARGWPKECARIVLAVGRYSKMRATGNLRGWLGFLALRDDPSAQAEIRAYAGVVRQMLSEKFPRTLALYSGGRS